MNNDKKTTGLWEKTSKKDGTKFCAGKLNKDAMREVFSLLQEGKDVGVLLFRVKSENNKAPKFNLMFVEDKSSQERPQNNYQENNFERDPWD